MKTRLMYGIVFVIAALGLGLGGQMLSARGHHYFQNTPAAGGVVSDSELVESLRCEHLFRSSVGDPDSTDVKAKVGMTDDEMLVLRSLAAECQAEIANLDDRAKAIIDEFRVKAAKATRLEDMPPPPSGLKGLQQQRNAIALRYKEMLRTGLGEARFQRVNAFAKDTINIEAIKAPGKPKA